MGAARRDSMIDSLYRLLNRLGFTDPLHAVLVHIPIGLIIGAFLFILVAIIFGRTKLVLTARHVSILAFIFVFPTILFGVFDWLHFFKGAMIAPIKAKMILASAVLVLLAAGIVVGSEIRVRTAPIAVLLALCFVAVIGLGYFGARMVYAGWGTGPVTSAKTGADPAIQAGEKVFGENCQACHANGGNAVVANLPLKTSKKLASLAEFTAFIRAPSMPDGSRGEMPSFGKDAISDAQAGDLYKYVSSMLSRWK
jgi:uncharacterized membrane protein